MDGPGRSRSLSPEVPEGASVHLLTSYSYGTLADPYSKTPGSTAMGWYHLFPRSSQALLWEQGSVPPLQRCGQPIAPFNVLLRHPWPETALSGYHTLDGWPAYFYCGIRPLGGTPFSTGLAWFFGFPVFPQRPTCWVKCSKDSILRWHLFAPSVQRHSLSCRCCHWSSWWHRLGFSLDGCVAHSWPVGLSCRIAGWGYCGTVLDNPVVVQRLLGFC